ncbi:unnamed protein product [Adineta steineri]|uniref:Glycosyltransferase 2-like domain-containing protein n=1 Tax=Adineta steineri TaxID=433720 RepID=A0A819Q8C8_9BILA|nr:unnamed protein product [Adineta steineri]CAF4027340.1 unnamed protein product [Adineta steineri]
MGNESIEEKFPLVDIIIVCCHEPSDILLDTVRSALALNYPKNKYRVWILDDGKDEFMEQYISKIRVIYQRSPLVKYIRRFKEENKPHYYKAGNINNGLNEIKRHVGQLGDFILIQDVDMLIHSNFLLRTLPHFEENDRVAYIQIGQNLYNLNSSDILCQGLIGQNKLLLHCDSKNGSSTCIGSGMLIKSCVLDEINGIPPYSTTEDFNFSFSIHKLGYKSIYLDEALQFGLTPDSLIGTIEQYKRWESGNFQVIYRRFRELFSFNKQTNRMTFFQRFLYFTLGIRMGYCIIQLNFLVLTLIGLWIRLPYLLLENTSIIKITLLITWIQCISNRLILYVMYYDVANGYNLSNCHSVNVTDENNTKTPKINSCLCVLQLVERMIQKSVWTAPFYFCNLVSMFINIPQKFIPTRSYPSVHEERKHFLNLFLNLGTKGFLFHIIYILIALAGIVYRLTRIRSNNLIQSLWYISLVSINIYSLIPPIWFIVFPPAIRKRKDLLVYTEQNENQEPTVKLETNTSLYPTSKRTLLLLIFPSLFIVLATVSIILLYISTEFIQTFIINTNGTSI